jgi:hypothetical protein
MLLRSILVSATHEVVWVGIAVMLVVFVCLAMPPGPIGSPPLDGDPAVEATKARSIPDGEIENMER